LRLTSPHHLTSPRHLISPRHLTSPYNFTRLCFFTSPQHLTSPLDSPHLPSPPGDAFPCRIAVPCTRPCTGALPTTTTPIYRVFHTVSTGQSPCRPASIPSRIPGPCQARSDCRPAGRLPWLAGGGGAGVEWQRAMATAMEELPAGYGAARPPSSLPTTLCLSPSPSPSTAELPGSLFLFLSLSVSDPHHYPSLPPFPSVLSLPPFSPSSALTLNAAMRRVVGHAAQL
jgi:hypothetical protein